MNFVQHPSNNRVLGAPKDWDQLELPCGALPVTDVLLAPDMPAIQSYWRPTPAELHSLNDGGLVVLSICGVTMPPAMVQVVK